jgi:hypothetical protein
MLHSLPRCFLQAFGAPAWQFVALTLILILTTVSPAQTLARRLYLKDGSYQSVTKYEVKGDRVRLFSAERDEWEEIPNSLVDWPATEKYEKDRVAGASTPEAVQLDKELEHESELAEARLPEVAHGLRLPENNGVFLLEDFQGGPQILEIQQTAGDLNRNTKGNIFRGAINPVAGLKLTIELDGAHAAVQSHVEVPSLYINVDTESDQGATQTTKPESATPAQKGKPSDQAPPASPSDRYRVVRLDVKNGKRIVGDVKRQVTGKVSQQQHFVNTTITRLAGGWLKLTPTESLAAGEYALVEMLGKEGINLYVWDFGVNPKAPANPNPWKPDTRSASPPPSGPKPEQKPD